jgi:pilus assembly protein Flp/PilA
MLFLLREEGQGLVEYGMIIVLVAVAVVAILLLLGPTIAEWYHVIMDAFPSD